ncbi:MAG: alcohol dehydrogenase catalytic domain-containing protein [Chloroflexota bacterium]
MKAVVFHGAGDLRLDEVPDPELAAGGVIVRTRTVGICGSDVRTWQHGSPRLRLPQVMGHELAGVIVRSDVPALPEGTPVAVCPSAPCRRCRWCTAGVHNLCGGRSVLGYDVPGGMAEAFAVGPAWIENGSVVPVGGRVPERHAALAEPLHTVLNGQDRAAVGPFDAALVLGLGPIGALHLAAARSRGARVVAGADPSADRRATAAGLVPGVPVLAMDDGWEARAKDLAGGDGFDVVIVAAPSKAAFATALAMAAPMGRVVAFAGLPQDDPGVEVDMNRIHYRQLSIVGAFGGSPLWFRRAVDWLAATDLDLDRFVLDRFPLADALAAFEHVRSGRGLKTLIDVG